jgi:hypothetical protein
MAGDNGDMKEGFNKNLHGKEGFSPKLDLQIGAFIHYEKNATTIFRDAHQHEVTLERVMCLNSEWDFENGVKNFPKPFLIGANGAIKEYGATVLYSYLNSTDARIVVFGPVQDLTLDHTDKVLNPEIKDYEKMREKHVSRNNKKRFFTVTEDGKGDVFVYLKGKENNGNIGIRIEGKEEANGNFILSLNGKFVLNMLTADGAETYTQLIFDNTSGEEKVKLKDKFANIVELNSEGMIFETATIRIGKDETVKKLLDDLIGAILKMTQNTPGGPTISPPINKAEFDAIKNRLAEFMDVQ